LEASYVKEWMRGFHDWLRRRPSSVFMLLGCSSISVFSLIIHSMYLDLVERMVVLWSQLQQIQQAVSLPERVALAPEKPVSVIFLPYLSMTFNCISRLLSRHIISVGLPLRKIPSFLRPVKDVLELKAPDVYSIPCKCGQVCMAVPSRPGSRSTSAISVWSIQTSQSWPNTALTWAAVFSSRTPPSSPPSPDS
jgi:hypothetical protein